MRYLIPILILLSCSAPKRAQWHYKKALKNGLKVVQDSDTIRITTVDSIPVIFNDYPDAIYFSTNPLYWELLIVLHFP